MILKRILLLLIVGGMLMFEGGIVSAEEVRISVSSEVESTSSKSVSNSVSVKSTGEGTSVKVNGKEVTENSDTIKDGVREKIEVTRNGAATKQAEVSTKTAEIREQVKEKVAEQRNEMVGNLLQRIVARLRAATNRFENILDRMDARAEKLTEEGANTKAVIADIQDLQEQNEGVREDISDLEVDAQEATESALTKTQFAAFRKSVLEIQKTLRELQKGLSSTMSDMINLSAD